MKEKVLRLSFKVGQTVPFKSFYCRGVKGARRGTDGVWRGVEGTRSGHRGGAEEVWRGH